MIVAVAAIVNEFVNGGSILAKQAGISLDALRAHLDKGRIAPLYLLAGAEPFLAQEALRLIGQALEAKEGQVSRITHDGETSRATVLDDARTLDLFSPARLVVVSPADAFVDKNAAALASYAEHPAPKACLVLITEKADARTRLVKTAQKTHSMVACNPLYDREVPAWITNHAKSLGLHVDRPVAQLLVEFLGADLGALAGELEKLRLYIGSRRQVTTDDVEEVSLRDRARGIFELGNAIGRKEPDKVMLILNRLLEQGEKPGGILFLTSRHIRKLWGASELIRNGEEPSAAARRVGVNYFIDQFLHQVNAFTVREFRRSCSVLLRCEAALKSSTMDERVLLETTFLRLTLPRTSPARAR